MSSNLKHRLDALEQHTVPQRIFVTYDGETFKEGEQTFSAPELAELEAQGAHVTVLRVTYGETRSHEPT